MLQHSPSGTWMPARVPQSTLILSFLLMMCSIVQSTTGGYDGRYVFPRTGISEIPRSLLCCSRHVSNECTSMLNGLNILPVYTDYFNLTPATTGLNTASVFIGGFLGPLVSGIIADRCGRRPAILYGSVITLIGITLQTAAQNIAMFVIGRIILGFGSAIQGIAGGVYLSETFPARWRAWGVGLLNDFYYVGALIAAGITLGTSTWDSTWAWRAPSLFQGIWAVLCISIIFFTPGMYPYVLDPGETLIPRLWFFPLQVQSNRCNRVAALALQTGVLRRSTHRCRAD
jgi:MFS family permease